MSESPMEVSDLQPGVSLAHFTIEEQIATGGMGTVFKAYEPALDRRVALKVLHPEFAASERYVANFQSEARAIAALNHPNIIPIYYIGQINNIVFFSMACIGGGTMDDWIAEGKRLTMEDARWFLDPSVSALAHAAESNMVHLDIKPSNFLVDSQSKIYLTDFGLARTLGTGEGQEQNEIFGTPYYIAPEQIQRLNMDIRTDIYSLGATLYHLCAGEPPYDADSIQDIVDGHLERPFPMGKLLKAGVPQCLAQLIQKMMERSPGRRFQNYGELQGAIHRLEEFRYTSPHSVDMGDLPDSASPKKTQSIPLPSTYQALKNLPMLLAVGLINDQEIQIIWKKNNDQHWMPWAKSCMARISGYGETLGTGKPQMVSISTDFCNLVMRKEGKETLVVLQDPQENLDELEATCLQVPLRKS